jgi:hypothetical protein
MGLHSLLRGQLYCYSCSQFSILQNDLLAIVMDLLEFWCGFNVETKKPSTPTNCYLFSVNSAIGTKCYVIVSITTRLIMCSTDKWLLCNGPIPREETDLKSVSPSLVNTRGSCCNLVNQNSLRTSRSRLV